jgi:hypothetical protein
MDKALCRTLATEAQQALAAIAQAHGLTVKVGGGSSFRPNKVVFEQADAAKLEFERYAPSFGLRPEHFGAEFTVGVRRFKIVGVNPRSTKYGISALCLDDSKRYKFSELDVERHLAREAQS